MKRYIFIFAACLAALSCGKEPEPVDPLMPVGRVTLEVTSDNRHVEMTEDGSSGDVLFKTKGGVVILDVLTNQDEWTYETSGEDWLKVSADDYFLTLTAEKNTSDKLKEATVIVKAADDNHEASVTLKVTQNHSGIPEISVSQNSLRVKAYTGLVNSIEIETNQDEWSFDCTCSWLLIEPGGENTIRLTADPNKTTTQRVAEIELKAGEASEWITVSQDGTAFVQLSTHNVAADDDGDIRKVTVTSNPELEWTCAVDEADWFSVSPEGNELKVTIHPNPGGNQRTGSLTVIVGDEDNNASAKVNVRQIGPDTEELIYEVLISEPDFLLTGAPVLTLSTGGSVTVDWGDGSEKETFDSRRPTHVYKKPGRYTIEMTGTAKGLEFGKDDAVSPELQSVISWGKLGYTTAVDMCLGCSNLTSIPNDVAGSFASVKSFLGAFSCCESLEEIPAGLFRYATVAKNFEDCFSHSGSISEIPEDLFANCPAAEDFSYTFYGTGSGYILTNSTLSNFAEVRELVSDGKLKSIPEGLFRNCPAIKQLDYTFGATSITAIPEDIFMTAANATAFTGVFSSCVNLTDVPKGFMLGAASAKDIKYMFAGCESLKTFPAGAFADMSTITNLEYIFYKTGFETLPGGIFEGLTEVKTIGAVFQDCISLTEISPDVFSGLTGAKSFKYCFSGCSSLRQIPSGLFAGLTNAYEFKSTFEDTALESIPGDLFKDARDYSSADFTYMLAGCMNLKTVPAELFEPFTKVTSPGFKNLFEGSGIETVPAGLFSKNTAVSTGFEETFYGCESLKTIEGAIFPVGSSVSTLSYTFYGCTSLKELPEGMFDNISASKTKFTATFKDCTSLETLPEGLFALNTLATQFSETFSGCSSLKSLPADLLGANEKITTVKKMFCDCSSLELLPVDLFTGNIGITSFEATFSGCTSLKSLPESLFASIGTKTSSVTFAECFRNCSSLESLPSSLFDTVRRINYINACFSGCTSLTGESPYTTIDGTKIHLYNRLKGTEFPVVPSYATSMAGCFTDCTGLTDYDSIPSNWK